MKYLRQLLIIFCITCIGEILKYIIPLPIPASIYGLVIMLICLTTGIIKLEHVKETGEFLVEIMPVMFIPAGVGLIASWESLSDILIPVLIITIISTFTTMIATGKISDFLLSKKEKGVTNHYDREFDE